ncbi:MAG: hypothetical protein JO278_15930 [Dyella sp.]|nr:hypothetical protein [Dyella sp.]
MAAEPITTGLAGAGGWKLLTGVAGAGAIGAGLAAIVVMCTTRPRSDSEWAVALISTGVGSICGCAAVVMKLGLQSWMQDYVGLVALGGLFFACGLPAWAVVRWLFNFIEKRRDKDLADVVGDVRDAVAGAKNG